MFSRIQRPLALSRAWSSMVKKGTTHTDWNMGKVLSWAEGCTRDCLKPCHNSRVSEEINTVSVSHATDPVIPDLKLVPPCYHDLGEVFS